MSSSARLAFRSVSFAYRGHPVLREVSLEVEPGEVVGIVGPNGAGKTTLLRLASGLLAPGRGEVLLDGESVHRLPRTEAARRIAGAAAEEESQFPYTVRDTVALGRHPWRGAFGGLSEEDEASIDAALAETDLALLADRPLPSLSSGERQRAALARCLVQGGDLVLLDEPTSHLDLGHRMRLFGVFRRRARERGQGILVVLHDLNLAGAVADRLVLLVEGRVDAAGSAADVLTPERVGRAFGATVHVVAHPVTGAPVLVPELEEGVS